MGRTQIYLGDGELELLDRAETITGASRSELVRRAVRRVYGETTTDEKLRALEASAGSVESFGLTGAEYVDRVRVDLGERLRRSGLAG